MAKEQKQEPPTPAPEVPEVAGPPKSYRLYISLGFVSLILFQMIVLFLLIPPKQEVPPFGLPQGDEYGDTPGVSPELIKQKAMATLPIGDKNSFKNFNFPQDDGTETFSLVMHVYVEKTDESKFNTLYEAHSIEIIDEVAAVLRATSLDDRQEAGHTAIKERVKKKINDILGVPYVKRVFFIEVNHTKI